MAKTLLVRMESLTYPFVRMPEGKKVAIIGPGRVGMVIAHHLTVREIANEIVLVGRNLEKARAEAMDIMHASTFLHSRIQVTAGRMEDITGSEVVVMCASVPMPKDLQSRDSLARDNDKLMQELLPQVARHAPQAKLLMVSNPVDTLTWRALELTGFPAERVMGTGTLVDSMRYRKLLSESLAIHPDDIRAYVLGEHGSHQFPAVSTAQAAGVMLDDTPERRELFRQASTQGLEVFQKKGNTCYAIGFAVVYIIESILLDECRTIPLSVKISGYLGIDDVCLSLPVVIGKNGIHCELSPSLTGREQEEFRLAAKAVRKIIDDLG